MTEQLILEFTTKEQADACLAVINMIAAGYWVEQGYTVIDTPQGKAVVGKNAATGESEMDSAKTVTWDKVRQSPDNTFYFTDPASNPDFSEWEVRANAAGYVFDGQRKEKPIEWDEGDDLPELINELNPEEKVG